MCMVVAAPHVEAAISCGQVVSSLSPCISYLRSSGGAVPAPCCNGVKSLNNVAKTTPDRQTACKCIKSAAAGISGINYGLGEVRWMEVRSMYLFGNIARERKKHIYA
ncbi:hypothetical protein RHGRI_010810 [Rhododendron griersonianum]|uniref:Non-specific lipid-transfer protein n=1 Tax=Rhododendron griersonianum TaxID=479676 RepID=A0AAV6KJZ3_9ERIC|nr:hypothetical protein RHGRI_010810 [Rhododendron griersonianum]